MANSSKAIKSEAAVMGTEPVLKGEISNSDLAIALNWYNYFYTVDDSRKWLIDYMKTKNYTKNDITVIEKTSSRNLTQTMCSFARMLTRGAVFPNTLDDRLKQIISQQQTTKPVVVFKQHRANETITALDIIIDKFITNKYKRAVIDITELVSHHSQTDKARAIVHYTDLANEIETEDEGYDHLTTRQRTQYVRFVNSLVEQLSTQKTVRQKPRVVRKAKAKTPQKIVSKLKYMAKCPELEITSFSAEKLVEYSVVWVYDTKRRKLAKYISSDGEKLSVRRSMIVNFCPTKSSQKTIRKPDVVTKIYNDGKNVCVKTYQTIKAKEKPVSGRINTNMLLVRGFK